MRYTSTGHRRLFFQPGKQLPVLSPVAWHLLDCLFVTVRLLVVVGLVMTVTGSYCWAGGVRPSAEPRFGVEGERQRMVLPLSAFPLGEPRVERSRSTINVTLAALESRGSVAYTPAAGSAGSEGVRDAVVRAGTVVVNTTREVKQAQAFLLREPPRLVVDFFLGGSIAARSAMGRAAGTVTVQANETIGRAAQLPVHRSYRLDEYAGRTMIWPAIDASFYVGTDTPVAARKTISERIKTVERFARAARKGSADARGARQEAAPARQYLPADAPAAAHFLEADLEYLRAVGGNGSFFRAAALYRRAVRLAPGFPDRERGFLMVGFSELALGLGAEAAVTFETRAHKAIEPAVQSIAYFAAGRASRAARRNDRARRFLRRAIVVDEWGEGGCSARPLLAVIEAEHRRVRKAVKLFGELHDRCPGHVARSPRTILSEAGVLAAAGRIGRAEGLLSALPALQGELFVRRRFLEADLALTQADYATARRAYGLVVDHDAAPRAVVSEARIRLARVDNLAGNTERAGEILSELSGESQLPATRAKALGTAAELLAGHGHYPEAMRVLERTDALGPVGLTIGEVTRKRLFRSWLARLDRQDDDAGILSAFYQYRGDGIGSHLHPDGVVRVAAAAVALGLPELAPTIVSPIRAVARGATLAKVRGVLAEAALATGEIAEVLRLTGAEAGSVGRGGEIRAIDRIRGKALVRLGRLDEADRLVRAGGDRSDLLALGAAYLRDGRDAERAYEVLETALAGTEEHVDGDPQTLEGWLALAAAAGHLGKPELAAAALRTAIRLFPDDVSPGVRYQLARFESAKTAPAVAAERYAAAAKSEDDPLFARVAAADAAFYRTLARLGDGNP